MRRVAIEQTLGSVKEYLQNNGFDVVDLNQHLTEVDAIVISGQDKDVLGMQDITTTAPVINAEGLTPEEVHQQLTNQS